MPSIFVTLCYIVSAAMFITGLKGLSHPRTAVRGNLMSSGAMLLAIVVTLLDKRIAGFGVILAGLVIGSGVGTFLALKIRMTAMPQLVGMFNGLGGGASALVAGVALLEAAPGGNPYPAEAFALATFLSGLIGAATFGGSLVAFGKLQGLLSEKAILLPGRQWIKIGLALFSLLLLALGVAVPHPAVFWLLTAASLGLGVFLVIAIGGADMPVVIALLNSYSGLAAAATGFVLNNLLLIVAGSLVGASGIILTRIMCRAMNRSLMNVFFGGLGGATAEEADSDDIYAGKIKSTTAEEVAVMLETASYVVIVPGYGLAVAQAQHAVRDLMNLLESRGTRVEFAIHPVAGRMPGHMNVLLAEADIPYEKLKELDDINSSIARADAALVIGANDVTNPMARQTTGTPVSGMPIINVDKARTAIVIKRSLSPGFAGIPNPLFAADHTLLFFGDGKKNILDLTRALKEG